MEKYKLLKDLPNARAGEIFEYASGKTQQLFSETSPATFSVQEIKEYDILNPDKGWFEKIEEKQEYGGRVPKEGDEYWVVYANGVIESQHWEDAESDGDLFECGSAFWTEEEAEKELKRRKAYVILKEDTKGLKPDWDNKKDSKSIVYYDHDPKKLYARLFWGLQYLPDLVFATLEDAEASIKAHHQQWIDYLGIEEEQ